MKLVSSKKVGPWKLDIEERKDDNKQSYFCIRGQKRNHDTPYYFGSFSNKRIAQMKLQSLDPFEAQRSMRAEMPNKSKN